MDMAKLCSSNLFSSPFATWKPSRTVRFSNAFVFQCKVSSLGALRRECRPGGFQRRLLIASARSGDESEGVLATAEEAVPAESKEDTGTLSVVATAVEEVVPVESKEDIETSSVVATAEEEVVPEEDTETSSGDGAEEDDGELTPEEQEDQECVDQIVKVLDLLKQNRDMIPNEVRLIVMIEDPREESLGTLNESGEWTSLRDEMGNAVVDISEGRVPKNREVLRALRDELLSWPNLEITPERKDARESAYAQLIETGVDPAIAKEQANADWDAAAEIIPGQKKDLSDKVPPAVGYGLLYFVSLVPILIGVTVVAILFFSSFQ